jgi:hypothetical protein
MVTSSGTGIGERWVALAEVPEEGRGAQMRAIIEEVLALDGEAQGEAVRAMVTAEYGLPDEQLKPFTASRLRAWLDIAADDLSAAKEMAHQYDMAFDRLPAQMAMRRSTTVQGVARTTLTPEEVRGLFDLIPSIVRQVPRLAVSDALPKQAKPPMEERKKPFWKFWG